MVTISSVMVKLLAAQPFESEALDKLAESMKATPITKKDKLHRYYKSSSLPIACLAYPDALIFNSNYYNMLTPDEVLAVAAHEFNHIAKKHILKRLPRTFLPAAALAALTGYLVFVDSSSPNRGLLTVSAAVFSLIFFLIASLYVNAKWLRQQETQCDLSALKFVNGDVMISSLSKLRPQKISSWDAKLTKLMPHTHPTIEQRIRDIQEAMKQ